MPLLPAVSAGNRGLTLFSMLAFAAIIPYQLFHTGAISGRIPAMKKIDLIIESMIFQSRWILAPFFIGLILAIIALLVKFLKELINLTGNIFSISSDQAIVSILTLVDTTLIASLLLIIIFSGYENFVSKIAFGEHEDRPV
jgi:uncharacterized membrane protein YqhA